MPLPPSFEQLMARRDQIRQELASATLGDLRPGSLKPRYRKCGKPNCHCARERDPGHGPKWVLSREVKGKMRTWAIPDDAVEETQRQVDQCRRLRQLTQELIEVSGRLCEWRLAEETPAPPVKKGVWRPSSRQKPGRRSNA